MYYWQCSKAFKHNAGMFKDEKEINQKLIYQRQGDGIGSRMAITQFKSNISFHIIVRNALRTEDKLLNFKA